MASALPIIAARAFAAGSRGREVGRRRAGWGRRLLWPVALLLLAWLAFFVGRGLVSSVLDAIELGRAAHRDRTAVESGIERQVVRRPSVPLVWRQPDGALVRGHVDRDALAAFMRDAEGRLDSARRRLRAAADGALAAALAPTFDAMRDRVPAYADWYFAWPTGYDMLGEAAASAGGWLVGPDVLTLRERLALDLERYVQRRFEAIVLRPELSDPAVAAAFEGALGGLRDGYGLTLAELDAAFAALVRRETTHLEPVPETAATVTLDWDTQRLKAGAAGYERAALLRAVPSVALALAGRSAGAAAARAVATRAAQPFVVRALGAAGLSVAGAGAGLLLGLGADYAMNGLVERSQRPRFEAETVEALDAIERTWAATMTAELERAIGAWFDDAVALLPEVPDAAPRVEGGPVR